MKSSSAIALQTYVFIVLILNLAVANTIFAQSKDDVHITENTTWSGNVNVSADTYIDEGVCLTINPGSTITFTGFFGLQVVGNIIAEGSSTDSIYFIPSNQATGWNRILFLFTSSESDSSKFSYCSFKYSKATDDSYLGGEAGGAMYLNYFEKISIQNCLFKNNYAIALGGALYCNYSSPHIINNIFDHNSADIDGGAIEFNHSAPRVIGNLFINNQTSGNGGALNFAYSSPLLTNNTIADNHAEYWGGAMCIDAGSAPVFTNCIFYNNTATESGDEVALSSNAGDPDFQYCLVSGGISAFGGDGAAGYNGNYENNLDTNPKFQGSGDEPYNIQVSSPCLNTGKADLSGLHLPALDLTGNPRVAQGCEERIDIGAYENQSQATSSFAGIISQDAHWCADTVRITGNVTVNNGVTLTIEKGTVVYIAGAYHIDIKGSLKAIGEQNDSIVFTTDNIWPYWSWGGMKFHNLEAGNDSSIIRFCRFSIGGSDSYTGGAISIDSWNKIEISRSRFSQDDTQHGGALAINSASITINNCLISNNTSIVGAGLYATNSTLELINCTFSGNTAENGDCNNSSASHGGGIYLHSCTSTIANCTITYNHADCYGGGIYSTGGNLQLQNNIITHNQSSFGGGVYLTGTSGEVIGNDISHNNASDAGGGYFSGGSLTISENRITYNYAYYEAAIYLSNCSPNIINNLISNNHAGTAGGGITFDNASPLLLNNTICYNHADNFAGCLHFGSNSNSSPIFRNCIIYGNYVIYIDGDNVYMYDDSGQPNFYYCDLEGGTEDFGGYFNNYTGDFENNIDSDPVFKKSGEHPFQLQQHSPCLNMGDAAIDTTSAGKLDLASNPRVQNGRIDMGCYENESFSDAYPGEAVHFTETDDLIVLDNESHFDFTESFTVEFWMNCDEMTIDNHLILKKDDAWAVQLFYDEAISIIEFSVNANGVFGDYQTTGTALLNQWNHVASVCSKLETGGYDITVYLNGLQGTLDNEGSLTHNNSPVTIGNDFLGKIDELRIWNKALSTQEIRENMHLMNYPGRDSLITYLQFNQNYDGRLVDIAGGNNGTLNNMNPQTSFVSSTAPAAQGTSNTQLVNTTGNIDFSGTGLSMNFTDKFGEDEIVVSQLDTSANINPVGQNRPFDSQYWIVKKYGTGSFTADLSFTVSEILQARDETYPDRTKLFHRGSNADTEWILSKAATVINSSENTILIPEISDFSQFILAGKLYPDSTSGMALDFNGVHQKINFGNNSIFNIPENFTFEAWMYFPEVNNNRDVLRKGNIRYLHFDDDYESVSGKGLQLDLPGLGTGWWEFQYDMEFNRWYHVAWTLAESGELNAYINGSLVRSANFPGTITSNSDSLIFAPEVIDPPFKGMIDELRLWNVSRTIDEIRENMCKTLNLDESGLIAYWQFNDSTSKTAIDQESTNNGSLKNMADTNWVTSSAPMPFTSILDGNWSEPSTWNTGQDVPEKDWSSVQISSDVTLDQNDTLAELKITDTGNLLINTTARLTVTGELQNHAGTTGLKLKSDASNTASLIHSTENISATVERFIPQYVGSAGWHDIASPVAVQAIRPEFVNNGIPDPNNDFYKFSEQQYLWINTKDDDGNWNNVFEDNFIVGSGYSVAYANDVSKTFAGELNVGDFTFDGTTTPAITYTADGSLGWNLMGNPYTSGLNWNECSKTNIDASVYAYDGDAGQYVSWNGSIGALNDGVIPAMNAFFIKASANPSLTIPNDARIHTNQNFYKDKSVVENLLVLKVEGNGFSDQTYVHFNTSATHLFDTDFDAYKLTGIYEAPQLYTKAGDSKLSINVLPYTSNEIVIPLGLKVGNEAEYKISVSENTFWETVDLSLKDLETGIIHNLKTNNSITINQSTSNPDRFLLLINGATGIKKNPAEDNTIEIYSFGDQIFIKTDEPGEVQVSLYNLIGQTIVSRTLTGFPRKLLGMSGLETGFYLIVVQTDKAMKTKKIFIK